jgi:hypothetical protein
VAARRDFAEAEAPLMVSYAHVSGLGQSSVDCSATKTIFVHLLGVAVGAFAATWFANYRQKTESQRAFHAGLLKSKAYQRGLRDVNVDAGTGRKKTHRRRR